MKKKYQKWRKEKIPTSIYNLPYIPTHLPSLVFVSLRGFKLPCGVISFRIKDTLSFSYKKFLATNSLSLGMSSFCFHYWRVIFLERELVASFSLLALCSTMSSSCHCFWCDEYFSLLSKISLCLPTVLICLCMNLFVFILLWVYQASWSLD